MEKNKKLSNGELDVLSGGAAFVSINGMEKLEATAKVYDGEVHLEYIMGGVKNDYNTGIVIDDAKNNGFLTMLKLRDHTFEIHRDDV